MSDRDESTDDLTPEDLARLIAEGHLPTGTVAEDPAEAPSEDQRRRQRRSLRRKILFGVLVAAAGVGASFMSCVGQSFSFRQARALEGIEQQLQLLRQDLRDARSPR